MNLAIKTNEPLIREDSGGRSMLHDDLGGRTMLQDEPGGQNALQDESGRRRKKLEDLLEPATNNISLQHTGLNRYGYIYTSRWELGGGNGGWREGAEVKVTPFLCGLFLVTPFLCGLFLVTPFLL